MSRGGAPKFLALLAVATASALAVVVLASERGGESEADLDTPTLPAETAPGSVANTGHQPISPTPAPGVSPAVDARATLIPRVIFFGEIIRARFDVTLDRDRVDPDSVRIATELAPWEILETRRERRDDGRKSYLRWTYTMRCLTGPCVPAGATAPLEFSPARVSFAPLIGSDGRRSIEVKLPLLVVYSRFSAAGFERADAGTPWRADLVSLPAVSYRISPNVAVAVLLLGSALLVAVAGALAYFALPRRTPALPPEPEPEPEPSLTPLEQALALLEESVRTDGSGDQRRALELVSEQLEEWGDPDLSSAARVLAWSEGVPASEQTTALAARVRAELERELLERSELDRNGAGHVV
ncbi:MAG TPA: hypothetical protein VHI53_00065 [Gaiellaceae bacterium]|nr:hypothetical protein [Gaiellaceae bacterium]